MSRTARSERGRTVRIAAVAALVGALVGAPTAASLAASGTPAVTPGSGPIGVAIAVPMTVRPEPTGLIDAETLEMYTGPAGGLTRQLDQIVRTGVAIGLDPMIPASIRVLGTAAPPSAVDWLRRLEAAPNEVFLLGYADVELATLARADALAASRPLDFSFALDPGAFGPRQTDAPTDAPTASPTPTDQPDPDEPPPLPTTEDLLAWPDALPGIAWPAEGGLTEDALPRLAAAGFETVIASSANLSQSGSALATVGDVDALVVSSELSLLLRGAVGELDEATRADMADRLGSALDGMAASHPGRTVLLTLDRTWPLGVYRLADAVAALEERSSLDVIPLSEVIAGAADDAAVVDAEIDPARTDRVAAVLAGERAEQDFSTIVTEPEALTAPRRLELLSLLSVSQLRAEDWDAASGEFLVRSHEITTAVQIEQSADSFILTAESSIPVRVSNALPFPVTVRIEARPLRPLLRVQDAPEVTVEPDSSLTQLVPIQAITNGRVGVQVTLVDPANPAHHVGTSRLVSVELQAQWEAFGLIVGAVVAVVFAAGIVRNIVVRRRRSRGGDDEATAGAGADAEAAEPRGDADAEASGEADAAVARAEADG